MNDRIPPEFEQTRSDGRMSDRGRSVDAGLGPASGAEGTGPGDGYGYAPGGAPADESELGLIHYLQILYKRRYVAVSALLLVVVAGALSTVTKPRIYEATVNLLIEREGPNVVSFQQVLSENDAFDDYYETQYGLLQSRALVRRTIETLELWDHPAFHQPPRITIRRIVTWPLAFVADLLEPPEPIEAPDAAETNAQSAIIDQFLAGTDIAPDGFSRLVDVTFSSTDPNLAALVANTLADEYILQSVELRSSTTLEASEFLGEQMAEQRAKLEESEQALQAYRERTDSVSLQERENIVVQRLSDLNAAVTRANATRIQKESVYRQVSEAQENPAALDSVPMIVSNPLVQQQKIELGRLQQQRAQLSEKLGPNHPDMVNINLTIQNAEASMRVEVARITVAMQSEFEAAVAEEQTLQATLAQQTREAQELNRARIEYGALERDTEADRQMFETLLQRAQETGVAGQLEAGNIRVVDYAETPTSPASP